METDLAENPRTEDYALTDGHSGIEPPLELSLQALEHLFLDAFDVSELAPASDIRVISGTLDLFDKLFHQPKLVRLFGPQMLLANLRSLFLPVLGP